MKQSAIAVVNANNPDREVQIRPIDYAIFRRLFTYTKPYARKRNSLLVLVVLRAIQVPLLTWCVGAVINGPIASRDLHGILLAVAGFLLFSLATQIMFSFRQRLALELGESVVHDLRRDMFEHLLAMPMGFFGQTKLGRIISRFTSDVEAVRTGIQNVVFVSMVQGGSMIVAATLMLWYDWKMFLVVAAISPVVWIINRYFRLRLLQAYREVQESFSRVTANVAETVKGMRVIQGYARQDVNAAIFRKLVVDHSGYNLKVAQTEAVFLPLLELNSQFFLCALVLLGGYRVLHPGATMTLGSFIQFLFLSNFIFSPIQNLAQQFNQALTAMAGAERVFTFLDRKPEWEEPPSGPLPGEVKGQVEFQDISFSYKKDRPALSGISFKAEPGQTVALVGPTGGGKTTITNLIAKFYLPTTGKVLIDGCDILDCNGTALRKRMGIVLQQNFLFTGTVLENILIGRSGATQAEAMEAARKLDCLDMFEALPDGLATKVGERGVGLSLGQCQLVCFSRAMLADPRIFILDEATSSVDAITEERLQIALSKLLAGRTSFVVAHRLSTIRNANLVIVLEKGSIVETGTHRQLLKKGGLYADLYRQFRVSHEF